MNKLDKFLSAIIFLATIFLLVWAGIIFNGSGEADGTINQVFTENGKTKIEFVSKSGDKEVFEYTGKSLPKKGPTKLKFFKSFFFIPKAIEIK